MSAQKGELSLKIRGGMLFSQRVFPELVVYIGWINGGVSQPLF